MNHFHGVIKKVVSLVLGAVLAITTLGLSTFTKASSTAAYSQSTRVTDVNGGTLTVTARADRGVIPDEAELSVTPITGGSIVYNDVADKVEKEASKDDKTVSGFLAYDISFLSDGKNVEPKGDVNVSMDWDDSIIPDGADKDAEVSVLHLKNSDKSVEKAKVVDLTSDTDTKKSSDDTNTATVTTKDSDNSVSSADMKVDSFSIFTITWTTTKDNNPSTRIGSVRVRYVNDNGEELDITKTGESSEEYTDDDLAKMSQTNGGIVELSSWAKDVSDPEDSSVTYTYDHATIGGRNGKTITGIKVQDGKETIQQQTGWEGEYPEGHATYTPVTVTTYKLYYTTDETVNENSSWTLYTDSSSGKSDNNANVFLVYRDANGSGHSGQNDDSDKSLTKEFTVHYQYKDNDGSYKNADIYKDNKSTGESIVKKTLSASDGEVKIIPLDPVNDSQTDSWVESDVRKPDGSSLIYTSTRIGSVSGPKVTSVSIQSDGTIEYHSSFARRMTSDGNGGWSYTETNGELKGRRFILTKGSDGNLTLRDSERGTIELNYANDAGYNGDASVAASYTATLHGEVTTSEYTVYSRYETTGTSTTPTQYYDLSVEESSPSTNTDIYQEYTLGDTNDDVIWIDDDTKYSGLYRSGISDHLSNEIETKKVTDVDYEWHRVTKEGDSDEKDTVVTRKQTGEHYNIAYSQGDRTWLDLEADEGSEIWSYGTKRSYYVTLSYKKNGVTYSLKSESVSVDYYGELENGSFDNPTIEGNEKYSFGGNNSNPINGYFSNDKDADHYSDQFVWKTTAPGTGNNKNKDIEVVNTASTQTGTNSWKYAYTWTSDGNWNSYRNDGADSGNQFAELNAESAGALYQDVITHPNDTLNYWFSHRARRDTDRNSNPKSGTPYDSMYLVIMPTELAMTMGENNSELATQNELEKFIEAHGGYDTQRATSEENKVTYRDVDSGILIRKVSSDDNDWHKILAASGYIAKGGLTRFFFVAGQTAADRPDGRGNTLGNFLDSVGFSQELPPTSGFNISFTETFSGITNEQLAGLATNAKDVSGAKAQEHPLKLTVSDTHSNTTGESKGQPNSALNGAVLGFTVSKSDSGYTITPTATGANGSDLFSSSVSHPGSSSVVTNSDGSITISWIFPDQELQNDSTDTGQGENFIYSANDYVVSDSYSTTDIAGFSKQRSESTSNSRSGATANNNIDDDSAVFSTITNGVTAVLNIVNVYVNDQPHISVRKTFTGVTPYTVRQMMADENDPFTINIKNEAGVTKQLKAAGNDSDVSVDQTIGDNGSTTYIWTITGWGEGSYEISESGYTVSTNDLNKVTLNGADITGNEGNPSGVQTDNSEIHITNVYSPAIKIQKQDAAEDANGNHKLLNNAVFRLYKKDNESKLYYQKADGASENLWMTEGTPEEFTTSNTLENYGDGIVALPSDLSQGIYYLEEWKAPDGYRAVKDIPFMIKEDGTVAMLNPSDENQEISRTEDGSVQMQYIDPYYTFIVSDKSGIIIPRTGGRGTFLFYILGGVLAAGAAVLLILRRRKA